MKNKQIIIGIAAGAAALAIAGVMLSRRRSASRGMMSEAENLADNFRGKLNSLQRKARKEFKNAADSGEEAANVAKERANQWVNQATGK